MRYQMKPIKSLKEGDIVKFGERWEFVQLIDCSSGFIDIYTDESVSKVKYPDTTVLCLVVNR